MASMGLLVDKCEDYHAIDLASLSSEGPLAPGRSGTIRWSRGGRTTGSVGYAIAPGGLRLRYMIHNRDGKSVAIDELFPLTCTPVAFGGSRPWLICIGCQRRCRVLFGGARFRCRRCHGLRYESQYEPAFARAASRCHKIRKRLGQVGSIELPFPPKPKGMHWRTYRRLEAEDARNQGLWAAGIMGPWLGDLLG